LLASRWHGRIIARARAGSDERGMLASAIAARLQHREVLTIRRARRDEVGMREAQPAGDLAHGVVLRDRHVRIDRRDGEAAVEQRELLLPGGRGGELAR